MCVRAVQSRRAGRVARARHIQCARHSARGNSFRATRVRRLAAALRKDRLRGLDIRYAHRNKAFCDIADTAARPHRNGAEFFDCARRVAAQAIPHQSRTRRRGDCLHARRKRRDLAGYLCGVHCGRGAHSHRRRDAGHVSHGIPR